MQITRRQLRKLISEEAIKTSSGTIKVEPGSELSKAIKYSNENPRETVIYYDKGDNLIHHLRGGISQNNFPGVKCDDADVTWKAKANWNDQGKKGYYGDFPFLTGKEIKMKPSISENKSMKITRKELRRLIAEAFKQKVPLFDPVTRSEIETLRQKGRQNADLSGLSQSARSSLETLEASDEQNMARELYQTFGSTEPDITVQQEEDFFAGQDAMLQDMSSFNVAQAYYKEVADYLTPTQIKILAKAANVPLQAVIDHSKHGIFFYHEDTREKFIDASVFDLMTRQIFLRNRNPSQSELNSIMNDTSDRINEVTHDLFKRIVKASSQTYINASDLEEIGIGELDEYGDWNTPFGELEIYNSYNDDVIDLIPTKLMLIL